MTCPAPRAIVGAYRIAEKGIVHGDLYGANVLVDDERRVSAVLDFGFVTGYRTLASQGPVPVAATHTGGC